ncbi:MAG: DUF5989 family protein [Myxococcota bacterium]
MKPMSTNLVPAPSLGVTRRAAVRASTLGNLCSLLVRNGRWWLIPMVGVMLGASVLLSVVTAIEYFAPFVYTVF